MFALLNGVDDRKRAIWNRWSLILIGVLLVGWIGTVTATPREPIWKVGRAIIQNDEQKDLSLKLSLRNEGKPGKTPVKILGRWNRKRDKEFTLLTQLTKEVELKQTAVVIIALEPLKPVPPGRPSLELLVMTGNRETDQKVIRLPE